MFQQINFKTAKTKLMGVTAALAIAGAALAAVPAGNQAQAGGFSIYIGPNYHDPYHHEYHGAHYGVSRYDVYRTLRHNGFYRIHRIRNHGHFYTARGSRGHHRYLVYVNARTGQIFRVRRV